MQCLSVNNFEIIILCYLLFPFTFFSDRELSKYSSGVIDTPYLFSIDNEKSRRIQYNLAVFNVLSKKLAYLHIIENFYIEFSSIAPKEL
jgi:hypothetical protein